MAEHPGGVDVIEPLRGLVDGPLLVNEQAEPLLRLADDSDYSFVCEAQDNEWVQKVALRLDGTGEERVLRVIEKPPRPGPAASIPKDPGRTRVTCDFCKRTHATADCIPKKLGLAATATQQEVILELDRRRTAGEPTVKITAKKLPEDRWIRDQDKWIREHNLPRLALCDPFMVSGLSLIHISEPTRPY